MFKYIFKLNIMQTIYNLRLLKEKMSTYDIFDRFMFEQNLCNIIKSSDNNLNNTKLEEDKKEMDERKEIYDIYQESIFKQGYISTCFHLLVLKPKRSGRWFLPLNYYFIKRSINQNFYPSLLLLFKNFEIDKPEETFNYYKKIFKTILWLYDNEKVSFEKKYIILSNIVNDTIILSPVPAENNIIYCYRLTDDILEKSDKYTDTNNFFSNRFDRVKWNSVDHFKL